MFCPTKPVLSHDEYASSLRTFYNIQASKIKSSFPIKYLSSYV